MKDVAAGVARFLPLARGSIDYYTRTYPQVDRGEIESAVMFALYKCVVRYEPGRGSFRALFQPRAYGAVRDAARDEDLLTRCDRGHVTRGETRRDGSVVVEPQSLSLDAPRRFWDEDDRRPENHDVVGATDPALEALFEGGQDIDVEGLLARLPHRERLALYLTYYEDLTQGQAGEIMGVTASRISQLCEKGLSRIRGRIGAQRSAPPGKVAA